MVCGAIFGTNVTTGPTIGGYSELNLRDNFTGDTIFTNDIELVGSGITLLNPLGTAALGSTIVMGQLKIGGGQELGLYLASGSSYHVLYFPRVSLTGGTATFSPKTPGFGAVGSAGSLLSLGNITQSSPSGFVMNGLTNLYLVGTNSYTGATTVSNGFLFVNGSNGPSAITVYGGVLGGTGVISGPVEIAAGGTLGPGNSIGTLSVSNSLMLDANSTNTMEINASSVTSDQVVGLTSVTYAGTLNVVNLGGTLAANQTYKLFDAASYAGTFSATNLPALGTGLAWDVSGLNSNGTIKLIATVNLNPTNITVAVNGNQLTLSWPTDHLGWTLQTNISSVLDTNWFAVPGSESSTQAVITISPAVPNVFYRLVHVLP
jgi:autotransporter-associated beta strand protein